MMAHSTPAKAVINPTFVGIAARIFVSKYLLVNANLGYILFFQALTTQKAHKRVASPVKI